MIYMDNAATTRPDRECLQKASEYIEDEFFNPSSRYAEGYRVSKELNEKREELASLLGRDFDVTFTSCGSESDNTAIFSGFKRGNVVSTQGEHSAVEKCLSELKSRGADVREAPLNRDGSVNEQALLDLVDENTSLVTVIHCNNETGAVNDIAGIAKKAKEKNKNLVFHSDGVQAFGKIDFHLTRDIDMYSASAHKIGAMKGCGALFVRKGVKLRPYIFGGGQERGLRSGTENVFGIMLFCEAAKKRYKNLAENFAHAKAVKEEIVKGLDKELFSFVEPESASPYILLLSANGKRGETVMRICDDAGLVVGTGAACSSNDKRRYSRVLLACGYDNAFADGEIRLSFSPENTLEEAREAARILNEAAKR